MSDYARLDERRLAAIPHLIEWYGSRIDDLKHEADVLTGSALMHRTGLLLLGHIPAHRQMQEWAERTLSKPCPTVDEDPQGYALWITCLRLLWRHAAAWNWRDDYLLEEWRPIPEGEAGPGFTSLEDALARGLPNRTE